MPLTTKRYARIQHEDLVGEIFTEVTYFDLTEYEAQALSKAISELTASDPASLLLFVEVKSEKGVGWMKHKE